MSLPPFSSIVVIIAGAVVALFAERVLNTIMLSRGTGKIPYECVILVMSTSTPTGRFANNSGNVSQNFSTIFYSTPKL